MEGTKLWPLYRHSIENCVRSWKKHQHFNEYPPPPPPFFLKEIMTRSEMAEKMFSSEKIM